LESQLSQGSDIRDLAKELWALQELVWTVLIYELVYEPNESSGEGKEHCSHSGQTFLRMEQELTF
jgi:hypothetical protein